AAIAAATALAFATIDPPPLKPRKKAEPVAAPMPAAPSQEASPSTPSPAPAPPALDTQLPQAALPPPPALSDFSPAKPTTQTKAGDLGKLPIDDLRARANDKDLAAMEELGQRLIQGTDVAKDTQAGAGWLLRAADLGSAQAAFDVGVMYERGVV